MTDSFPTRIHFQKAAWQFDCVALAGGARAAGNSVFVDEYFVPHPDQWAFLSSVRHVNRSVVESIVRSAEATDRILGVRFLSADDDENEPWSLPASRRRKHGPITQPLPASLNLVLGDEIYIAKEALSPGLRIRLLRTAAFQNPEFHRAQAMRLPTHDKPRSIACAEDHPSQISLPRGCLDDVRELLADLKVVPVIRDERVTGRPLTAEFRGALRPEQLAAANAMLAHDTGVLSAGTAFGKTIIAAWLIAQRRVNTLVLVHRRQLLEQWIERLSTFLALPPNSIGRIGGGRRRLSGAVDVALIQSLVRKSVVDDCVGEYGHLIVDECHHLPAHSFEQVARRAKARFVAGLSATVMRKDGHHPIIFMQCGPVRHRVDARQQAAARPFEHTVLVRPTAFRSVNEPQSDLRAQFHNLYAELAASESRNRLIQDDVVQTIARAGRPSC